MNHDNLYLCIITVGTGWCYLQVSGYRERVDAEDGDNMYLRNIGNITHFHTLLTTQEQSYQLFPDSTILQRNL
jgi:hypothetical protein